MSTKRKALRYGMKKQEQTLLSKKGGIATSMKLLRSVLAVGFAMTPWLGGEALAAGIVRVDDATGVPPSYLQSNENVAHIFAEQASGTTGLNRFKYFDVGAGQIANLYFQKKNGDPLNTLVNTVESQISISGTVNAVRNNKIGGNLYFLSPKGMVVGSKGVINAGSLTVIGTDKTFSSAEKAAEAVTANSWTLEGNSKIEISGQINAATGIDLRAAHIALKKDNAGQSTAGEGQTTNASSLPLLRTGMVFEKVVNTGNFQVKEGERLTATVDTTTKAITIVDPSNPTNDTTGDGVNRNLTGDGSIKLAASSTSKNAKTELWGVDDITNTVEATVDIGEGARIDAIGDANVSATATRANDNSIAEVWDIMAFTRANVNIDGDISGNNVNITATASSTYEGHNNQNIFEAADKVLEYTVEGITGTKRVVINDSLAQALTEKLFSLKVLGDKRQALTTLNNVVGQIYMPFAYADAKANIKQ